MTNKPTMRELAASYQFEIVGEDVVKAAKALRGGATIRAKLWTAAKRIFEYAIQGFILGQVLRWMEVVITVHS